MQDRYRASLTSSMGLATSVADKEGGAPSKSGSTMVFLIQFCIRMHQNKAQMPRESIQTLELSEPLKPLFNIVVDRLKNSKTELPDLSNYVQMDEKTTKNAKIMKVTHSLSRYLWKLYILSYTTIILAQWIWRWYFKFSLFWSTIWLLWSIIFSQLNFCTLSDILIAFRTMQLRFS